MTLFHVCVFCVCFVFVYVYEHECELVDGGVGVFVSTILAAIFGHFFGPMETKFKIPNLMNPCCALFNFLEFLQEVEQSTGISARLTHMVTVGKNPKCGYPEGVCSPPSTSVLCGCSFVSRHVMNYPRSLSYS